MNIARSPLVLGIAALVAFISMLITEAVFDDTINWVTVVLAPIATVIGITIGDSIRQRR